MHDSRNRSSVFRQKSAFGGFGSTPGQTSPLGSSFQQTRPAFGSNLFGSSSPFGASSQPAFAATSVPAFGSTSSSVFCATSTPAFGASSTPAFGAASTLAFGSTSTPAFGSTLTPLFGNTGMLFGASSAPAFGSPGRLLFSFSSTPAFGGSSTPAFGSSTTPAFGSPSTSPLSFGSAITFGQSSPTFGSSPFGSTPSPFGAQTSTPTFGSPGFGQLTFGSQVAGTRVTPYTATPEPDASDTQPAGMLESISVMPVYKDKSHEELRWEDCQRGDKGTSNKDGVHQVGEELNAINTAEIEVPVHCSADVRANVPMKSVPRNESVSAWKKPGVVALPSPGELGYIASIDGVAQLDAEEVQALVQKFEVAVVGRLLGKMIPFFHLNSGLKRMWDKFGQFKLILLSNDCFVCLFNSTESRHAVLMGGPWIIEGQVLGLDRWSPDLSPVSMHGFVMPVWVRLPDLPLYCWGTRSIASIASLLGEPLWIDDATDKMDGGEFARVCVRLDLSKPLKLGVMVQGLQGPFLQSVEYEGLSDFCFRCGLVGHKELSCQTKATSGAKAGTEVREAILQSEAGGTGLGCGPTAIVRNHGLKETHAGAMTENVEASCSEQVKEETAGEAEG